MSNSNEEFDQELYDELKAEYYEQTKAVKAANPLLDKALQKAAILCAQYEIDPDIYISAQIRYFKPRTGQKHMYPNDFVSKDAVANAHSYLSVEKNDCTWMGSWKNQKYYLSSAINNTKRTIEEILLDHNIGLRPWFRCLITKHPIPSVIKKYGYQASQELKLHDLQVFFEHLKREEKVEFDFSRIPEYW